jgi:hypothetical protein
MADDQPWVPLRLVSTRQGGVPLPSLGIGRSRACRSLDDRLTGHTQACTDDVRRRPQGHRRQGAADLGISLSPFNHRVRAV